VERSLDVEVKDAAGAMLKRIDFTVGQ